MEKVWIERLPETKERDGAKRWVDDKGEFVQIAYGEEIWHVALFELKPGHWRGSHYHEKKEETFYVVRGKVRCVCIDIDSGAREEFVISRGDKMRVVPRCAHIFYGMEDALVVEYSPQKYDKGDAFRFEFEEAR